MLDQVIVPSSEILYTQPRVSFPELNRFETSQTAWIASLNQLYHDGTWVPGVCDPRSVGSAFGEKPRPTREILLSTFSVASPRQRLIYSAYRLIDLGYAIANVIWVLTGSDDAELISFYNPRGRCFSDDGATLCAAPGTRIFHSSDGDQFERSIQRLKQDPSTRRAVIQVFTPADLMGDVRDSSCTLSLQFMLRNNRLECITSMRSQSALMVMPYDLFLFSMIHEALACCVGAEPGAYHHVCGSLHYYEDEEEIVRRVIQSNEAPVAEMPAMYSASREVRKNLGVAEQDIRQRLLENSQALIDFCQYELDPYWTTLLRIMVAGARRRQGVKISATELKELPYLYYSFLNS